MLVCHEAVFTACVHHDAIVSSHCVHHEAQKKHSSIRIAVYVIEVVCIHVVFMGTSTSVADIHTHTVGLNST